MPGGDSTAPAMTSHRSFMLKRNPLILLSLLAVLSLIQCDRPDLPEEGRQITPFPVPQISFEPLHYIAYRTDEPITVDGRLDEEVWDLVPWTEDFVDIEGPLRPLPTWRTRVKMLWDDDYFYFAAELVEPHVWGTLTERDAVIFHDNDFEIFIDPDGDTHNYFEFEINPLGTMWDLFLPRPYRDGTRAINSWNMTDFQSAVHVDGELNNPEGEDRGWTVEVALPMSTLRRGATGNRAPQPGDQWRVNFSRVQWQADIVDGEYRKRINPETGRPFPEDNWVWSPQGLVNMHYPEMWGFVQFSGKSAGEGSDPFVWNRDEEIKWVLRQVYYLQRDHQRRHGSFTDDPSLLGMESIQLDGMDAVPELRITQTQFEASLPGWDDESTWYIRTDGKVWKE